MLKHKRGKDPAAVNAGSALTPLWEVITKPGPPGPHPYWFVIYISGISLDDLGGASEVSSFIVKVGRLRAFGVRL